MRQIGTIANRGRTWSLTLEILGTPPPDPDRSYPEGAMAGRPPSGEALLFGRRLSALRKERTQAQLAAELGIKHSLVAYYERRAKNPTLEVAHKIARFFEVPIGSLRDEPPKGKKP